MFQPGPFLTPRTKKNKNEKPRKNQRTARAVRGAIRGIHQSNRRQSSHSISVWFPWRTWKGKWWDMGEAERKMGHIARGPWWESVKGASQPQGGWETWHAVWHGSSLWCTREPGHQAQEKSINDSGLNMYFVLSYLSIQAGLEKKLFLHSFIYYVRNVCM